jgi:hypothetical protein
MGTLLGKQVSQLSPGSSAGSSVQSIPCNPKATQGLVLLVMAGVEDVGAVFSVTLKQLCSGDSCRGAAANMSPNTRPVAVQGRIPGAIYSGL